MANSILNFLIFILFTPISLPARATEDSKALKKQNDIAKKGKNLLNCLGFRSGSPYRLFGEIALFFFELGNSIFKPSYPKGREGIVLANAQIFINKCVV